jgi:hypothetical protein
MTIPLQYLMGVSNDGLERFALKRMADAANLRKEAKAIEQEALETEVEARLGYWLLENREELLRAVGSHLERIEDVA